MKTALLYSEFTNSVIFEKKNIRRINYTPFGFQDKKQINPAFIGVSKEAFGGYLFGNGRRTYLPSLQQFTQPDPISPFDSGLNSYSYANQDPINNHDITGLIPWPFTRKSAIGNMFSFLSNDLGFGKTKNVQRISDSIYIFDDFPKRGKRLNISAHGDIIEGRPRVQLESNRLGSPDDMMDMILPKIKDLESYTRARTLICYSADISPHYGAIGETVAKRTRLITKSYSGKVVANSLSRDLKDISRSARLIRENSDGSLDFRSGHTVAKVSFPFQPSYKPVYFYPQSIV